MNRLFFETSDTLYDVIIGEGINEDTYTVRDNNKNPYYKCRYDIFRERTLLVSFSLDDDYMMLCKNPANLGMDKVWMIARRIQLKTSRQK